MKRRSFLMLLALALAGAAQSSTITFPNPSNDGLAGITAFPQGAKAVTKSDTDVYEIAVSIYVGVTGDVAVTPANGGSSVTFVAVPAGSVIPVKVKAVLSTGTTASSLVAVY